MESTRSAASARRPAPVGHRLPDPCAVGMQRHAALARGRGQLDQLVPGRQQAAGIAQRQLDHGSAEPPADLGESRRRRGLAAGGQPLQLQAEHPARTVLLVADQVGHVGQRDAARPGPVAPGAQRGLLGHDPAGEHHGRGLAEQLGHLGLDLLDRATLAVDVARDVVRLGELRELAEHRRGRRRRPPEDRLRRCLGGAEPCNQLVAHDGLRTGA